MEAIRPWGNWTTLLVDEGRFKCKHIIVSPSHRLSLQSHIHRSEHWIIVRGSGVVTVGDDEFSVGINSHVFIQKNVRHRIHNTDTSEPLVFVEVQLGSHLSEDDITRYEDDYNRTCGPIIEKDI